MARGVLRATLAAVGGPLLCVLAVSFAGAGRATSDQATSPRRDSRVIQCRDGRIVEDEPSVEPRDAAAEQAAFA